MAENKELYDKAATLMMSALKKYSDGDIEEGDNDRRLANQYFDKAKEESNAEENEIQSLYGENRNFGIIYHVFESNADKLYKTNEGRKVISKFVKLIKENQYLKEQFDAYNSILSATNPECFDEIRTLLPQYDKKINEVKKANNKLLKILRESKDINELIDIDEDRLTVYSNIENMLLKPHGYKHIAEHVTYSNQIKKFISENHKTSSEDKLDESKKSYTDTIKDVLGKYENNITEEELKIFNCLHNGIGDKKTLFEETKKNTLADLNKVISECNKDEVASWQNIINEVTSKNFNELSVNDDVLDMLNIQNVIS
jgi:hypothetical protein